MEPPELLSQEIESAPPAQTPGVWECFRHDYVLQALLILTFLVNLGLIGFLVIRYDAFPDPLPLHFDASGLPDRIDAKTGIIALPAIGFIVFGLNVVLGSLAYRRERAATVLLVVGALFVQILMWLATINAAGGLLGT